jgi:NAD(P)-dependent dehydrogenase (short-subunit alcohol dehydrogenase family)
MSDGDAPFSEADLASCLKVLLAVAADRGVLAGVARDDRLRLLEAAGRVSLPNRAEQRKLAKAFRRRERVKEKAADQAVLEATGIRTLRREPVFPTPAPAIETGQEAEPSATKGPSEVQRQRKCYVCKAEFRSLHFFYDQLCPSCGDLNYAKRTQTASLDGRVALVTGARVKIGYQAAMMLLRAGARVIVTTRFPHDAAARYAREPDFPRFRGRLEIHGLDLRLTPAVERFAHLLDTRYDRLDFILHNACQTVRRPPAFYAHLLDIESASLAALPTELRPLLAAHHEERRSRHARHSPAQLSQAVLLPEERALTGKVELFPQGELDADLQQVDLEVHLVNAIAPFVLSSKLKPLLLRTPSPDKHIVNVSAMEGQFYRDFKTDKHPHTNMAKAALNMLTRTSAADYARDGIYMNSVDTGWVTDEDPVFLAARKREEHGFSPPLDVVDGAARICDPIFSSIQTGTPVWGLFFKDYTPTPW